jgi:hypothetical protein
MRRSLPPPIRSAANQPKEPSMSDNPQQGQGDDASSSSGQPARQRQQGGQRTTPGGSNPSGGGQQSQAAGSSSDDARQGRSVHRGQEDVDRNLDDDSGGADDIPLQQGSDNTNRSSGEQNR